MNIFGDRDVEYEPAPDEDVFFDVPDEYAVARNIAGITVWPLGGGVVRVIGGSAERRLRVLGTDAAIGRGLVLRPEGSTDLDDRVLAKGQLLIFAANRDEANAVLAEIRGAGVASEPLGPIVEGEEGSLLVQIVAANSQELVKAFTAILALHINDVPHGPRVDFNVIYRLGLASSPPAQTDADTDYDDQWHLCLLRVPDAWNHVDRKALAGVTIAVIDDTIYFSHPDFAGKFASGAMPPQAGAGSHGTKCAGVAAAASGGGPLVGVAPDARVARHILPGRIGDSLTADSAQLIAIFAAAAKSARIISCSWGFYPQTHPITPALYKRLTEITEDTADMNDTNDTKGRPGCIIIFAAMNNNAHLNECNNLDWYDPDPAPGTPHRKKFCGIFRNDLTSHPGVLCVAASTRDNRYALYTNYGRDVDVCAPSGDFDPLNPGPSFQNGIWTTLPAEEADVPDEIHIGSFNGTSAAVPMVAGVAALMLAVKPTLTAKQVRDIIRTSAEKIDLNNTGWNEVCQSSHKCFPPDKRPHHPRYGYGRLNARAAVDAAKLVP